MPEGENVGPPMPSPDIAPAEGPGTGSLERRRALRWVLSIGALGATSAALFNVVLFFQTGAWQMLAVAGGSLLAIACLLPAWWLGRRDRFDAAGVWTLGGMLLAFALGELFHQGLTPYLTVGGLLLIFVVGFLLLPGRWWAWLVTAAAFGAYVWLVNRVLPLPRFPMAEVGTLSDVFAVGLVAFLAAAALLGIFLGYRRLVSLRTRLIASFVIVALLPVVAIVVGLASVGLPASREQALNRLEPVAILKESEVLEWLSDLQTDQDLVLAGQQVGPNVQALLAAPAGSEEAQMAATRLRERLTQVLERTGRYQELFLLNAEGTVLISTDLAREGEARGNQLYFRKGLTAPYIQPPYYSVTTMRASLFVSRPVQDESGQTLGVLAGRASLASLDELMGRSAGLGETGETYLVGRNHALLSPTRFSRLNVPIYSPGVNTAVDDNRSGSGAYERLGVPVFGSYRWLPELEVALIAEQEEAEALAIVRTALSIVSIIALAGVLGAIVVSLLATRSIADPILKLTETTAQMAAGDLSLVAPVEREDEIGTLARTFNTLTARLRDLIGSLEDRVADRTHELERRSAYLEASAEVARTAGSVLDPEQLVEQVVDLIRDRFDLYYVGLFLVDEAGEWAVLHAGTGEAGQAMLARRHRIQIGEGMIGWSVANEQWRVALEAGEDAVRLEMPELPKTRSEAALPLRSRGRVIGALTVQATQPRAFEEETIVVLQTMADQVAVALDNARLFAHSQDALEAERRAYGEISREAWQQMIRGRSTRGYRCDERGVFAMGADQQPAPAAGDGPREQPAASERTVVAVPIPIRDQVVGTLHFRKGGDGESWTDREVAILGEMAEQLGLALDSARLYQDTQRRAAREQLTTEITARIRETLDVEAVLRATAREVRQALGVPEVVVRLGSKPPGRGDEGAAGGHG